MSTVGVNPPKTPVTEGSNDMAPATLPNVCKMPGPPAPFVPTPLPNIGMSSDRLTEATTTVKFEGNKVAIKGSYYMSQPSPDVASQGTGGGIVSSTVQGKTEFVAPGSMTVKAEGKNIQLLGDAMTNNGGSPANSGTMPGNQQPPASVGVIVLECDPTWSPCQKKQMKAKADKLDGVAKQGKARGRNTYEGGKPTLARKNGNGWAAKYARIGIKRHRKAGRRGAIPPSSRSSFTMTARRPTIRSARRWKRIMFTKCSWAVARKGHSSGWMERSTAHPDGRSRLSGRPRRIHRASPPRTADCSGVHHEWEFAETYREGSP